MTFIEKENFAKFGKVFQENLCKLLIDERPFCDQISEVLEPNFFELRYIQILSGMVFAYKKKYSVHPSYDVLTTLIRTTLGDEDEVTQKQVRDLFARIQTAKLHESAEFIKETSLDFCKKQKLKEAIARSINLLSESSSSFEQIKVFIDEALRLGSDRNFGHEFIADFENRYIHLARDPITTGWPLIDKLTQGGTGIGELDVAIAPTGAGKSMILTHRGAAALRAGRNVVHYTLELKDTEIGKRYDSCLTGIELDELTLNKEKILEDIKLIRGQLIIKEYPVKSASTQTIRNHLLKLETRGYKVDVVVIDYADLLRPVSREREKRNELETIYEELRALAQEFRVRVLTASQTNRGGYSAEVVSLENIAEAYSKCFVADFIYTLSRTAEDKATNGGRIFVAKNRNGADGLIFPIFMDTASVTIRVLSQTGETPDSLKEKNVKDALLALRKKYQEGSLSSSPE